MKTYLVWLALVGGCGECYGAEPDDCVTDTCRGLDPRDCVAVGQCHLGAYKSGGLTVRTECVDSIPSAESSGPACDTVDAHSCYLRTDCTSVFEHCDPPTVVCPAESWMLTACE